MFEEKINIEDTIDDTLVNIENDINEIASILQETYKAMLTLDEKKWKAKEKERIDEDFMPYLKKISEKYPIYLTNKLNYAKNAVKTYRELDKQISNLTQNLNDTL